MACFLIRFDGEGREQVPVECESIEHARNAAIFLLGKRLQEDPTFAYERHWRVDLHDEANRLLLHVIVATVDAPKPINWASFD